ncbi:hypothetical protein DFH28DRAFT_956140 [Melampsora americana]|nr:hypothetical protein DFH28DRAFT_956140 [Melampsora americana]
MKKIFWTILVNFISSQKQLHALNPNRLHSLDWVMDESISSSISNSDPVKEEINIPKSFLEDTPVPPSEWMEVFWETNFDVTNCKALYPELLEEIRNLMKSDKETWAQRIIEIFDKLEKEESKRNVFEHIVLFESLIQLLEMAQIPIEAMLVVWARVLDLEVVAQDFNGFDHLEFWVKHAQKIKFLFGQKIIERIKTLETGKELNRFSIIHRGLGNQAIEMTGDWSPESQKELFALWTDDKTRSCEGITKDKKLQNVLETQIVQTFLIKAIHAHPSVDDDAGRIYTHWTVATLKEQSNTVVTYINSLNHLTTKPFILAQRFLQPYQMRIDPPMSYTHCLNIVKFWATYVELFVMMKDLEETKPLKDAINTLVADNVQEANKRMNEFLKTIDIPGFNLGKPILAQFLEFCVKNTEIWEQRQISKDALNNYLKE